MLTSIRQNTRNSSAGAKWVTEKGRLVPEPSRPALPWAGQGETPRCRFNGGARSVLKCRNPQSGGFLFWLIPKRR